MWNFQNTARCLGAESQRDYRWPISANFWRAKPAKPKKYRVYVYLFEYIIHLFIQKGCHKLSTFYKLHLKELLRKTVYYFWFHMVT